MGTESNRIQSKGLLIGLAVLAAVILVWSTEFWRRSQQQSEFASSYTSLKRTVFDRKCVICHGTMGEVNLESYARVMENVKPMNPEGSQLYRSVRTRAMPAPIYDGKRIVENPQPLSESELKSIYDWIKRGAPND